MTHNFPSWRRIFSLVGFLLLGPILMLQAEDQQHYCLHPACRRCYPPPFLHLDRNHDDVIDPGEWQIAFQHEYGRPDQQLRVFRQLDRNHNQRLERAELDRHPVFGSARLYVQSVGGQQRSYCLCWQHRGRWRCEFEPSSNSPHIYKLSDDNRPRRIEYWDAKRGKNRVAYNPDCCEVRGCSQAHTMIYQYLEPGTGIQQKNVCLKHYRQYLQQRTRVSLFGRLGLVILCGSLGVLAYCWRWRRQSSSGQSLLLVGLLLTLLSGVSGCVSRQEYQHLQTLYLNQVKVIYDQEATIKRLTEENQALEEQLHQMMASPKRRSK